MIIATGAAIKYGVHGLSDQGWDRIEAERERTSSSSPAGAPGEQRVVICQRIASKKPDAETEVANEHQTN
jgi:hypothetical protein